MEAARVRHGGRPRRGGHRIGGRAPGGTGSGRVCGARRCGVRVGRDAVVLSRGGLPGGCGGGVGRCGVRDRPGGYGTGAGSGGRGDRSRRRRAIRHRTGYRTRYRPEPRPRVRAPCRRAGGRAVRVGLAVRVVAACWSRAGVGGGRVRPAVSGAGGRPGSCAAARCCAGARAVRGHAGGWFEGAGRGEARWKGAELVEYLDQLVVGAGLGQEFGGLGEGLAGSRGGAEPCLRVRLQQRGHNLPERLGYALRGAGRAVFREVLDERLGVRFGALQEVERDQAHGEQVGGEVRVGAQHLLGSEVTGRAHHVVGLCQPRLAQSHRDAEVGQPQPGASRTGRFEQHVGGLDVTVDDAFRVHGGEARQELVEERADERGGQRAVVRDQVDERAPGDQVHGEQDLVVVGGPAGRGEDVRVVDPQRLFADEAQQRVGVALLEDLGGHVPAAAVVPGAPDGADSSTPDRVGQFVPAGEDLTHGSASIPLRIPPRSALDRRNAPVVRLPPTPLRSPLSPRSPRT